MELIATYHGFCWWLQRHSPGSDKFLHINAGLALWVITALMSRRSFASWWSLAPMLVIESLNEIADYVDGRGWTLPDTIGDMVATWGWPIVLVLLFRHRRRTSAAHQATHAAPAPKSVDAIVSPQPVFRTRPAERRYRAA